ncbi:MAG: class I SAM-dependent methyltransferase [Nitrospina sp.]|nr:class I SAM-dependent methyltransferase [Nitrospina sp.]
METKRQNESRHIHNTSTSMVTENIERCNTSYYSNKIERLQDIFGTENIVLEKQNIIIRGHSYPVVDDVVILLDPSQYPPSVSRLLSSSPNTSEKTTTDFAEDIQFTFGAEWLTYPDIMPEHKDEFALYFDLINIPDLKDMRVCDLGCGIGRWSHFLKDKCRELILLDFSEAIFVARKNLRDSENAIFFMGDIKRLPFRKSFADFLFCIGVLHHLPVNALEEVKVLKKYAPTILIYLYYALDNRPFYFRLLLNIITSIRKVVSRIKAPSFRNSFSTFTAWTVYVPLVYLGKIFKPFGLSRFVPIHEAHDGQRVQRIKQDVYDRFFTRIEQRFTKKQILELNKEFDRITISDHPPYWHFKCENKTSSHDNQG